MASARNSPKSPVEVGSFVCSTSIHLEGEAVGSRRKCELKLLRSSNPPKLLVRIVEVDQDGGFCGMYLSSVDEDFFRAFSRKKRFSGSFLDYVSQLKDLLESCSVERNKRQLRIADHEGNLFLEVMEAGTFKALAMVSVPCTKMADKEAVAVLKQELDSVEAHIESQRSERSRLGQELASRTRRYGEERERLRAAEVELKHNAETWEAKLEEERRRRTRALDMKRRQELEALTAELDKENAVVEHLEAREASFSRKTEVIALEKSELEEAIRFLKQQKATAEEAKRLGKEEEEVLRGEIRDFKRQTEANDSAIRDLDQQIAEWESRIAELDRQIIEIDAEEGRLQVLLKKRTDVAQTLSADLLAANRQIAAVQKHCSDTLVKINTLEAVTLRKEQCISANHALMVEANRRLAKCERERKLAIEAGDAKAKEAKLAELERELKINREVISYMDRKLERRSTDAVKEAEQKDGRLELEKIYTFPGLHIK